MKSLLEVFFSGSKLSSANLVLGAKPEVKFPVVLNHLQPEGKRNLKGRGRMEKKRREEKMGHKPHRLRSQRGKHLEKHGRQNVQKLKS